MTRTATKCPARLVGIRRRGRAGLLRSTALQAAVLVAIELPGGVLPAAAQPAPNARPQGGQVTAGQASISQTPATTIVDQSSQRAAVNWTSFDVGRNQTVDFQQPSSGAWTLNRVSGADPSQIAGHIEANGNIVLTNPSGVVFYRGSEVNAESVVISAPGITNQNFMAGRMVFDQAAHRNARIVNAGSITVREAGLAALVAPQVANSGVITAKLGHVVLAGAATDTLDMYGDGLLSFDVTNAVRQAPRGPDGKPATALVTNSGMILASGGTVQLTARAADGIVQDLVDAKGRIAADTAGARTGTIVIDGTGGSIRIAGNISANGPGAAQQGGQIELNATRNVVLTNGARVSASGGGGGGTVAVGTTLARANGGPAVTPTLIAKRTLIARGARIAADATKQGNGGKVTVLSKRATAMRGAITAEGGPGGGNGGNVEVSGERGFALTGPVDVSNRGPGLRGTILLDPTDLTVIDGTIDSGNADGTVATNMGTLDFDQGPATATVSNGEIDSLTGNVVLQASHDLNVDASFSVGGNVDLRAGHVLTVAGSVTVSGVNIRLDGGENFNTGSVTGNGGVIVDGELEAFGGSPQGIIELHAGSLGVAVNGTLFGNELLVVATGPAGVQFGARSAVFPFGSGLVDVSTLGGGGVTQAGTNTSIISASTLQSSQGIAGDVNLPSTLDSFVNLANFRAGGSISIASFPNSGQVTIDGTLTSPSAVSLDIGGPLLVSGVISAPAVSLTATQFAGTPGDITQSGGSIAGTNSVKLMADGFISQTGGVIITGTLSGSSGNNILQSCSCDTGTTTLNSAGNTIANLGNFTSVGGFALTDAAALAVPGSVTDTVSIGLNVTGPLTLAGTLHAPFVSLGATGDIIQNAGAIAVTGQLSATSGGTISLTSASNTIAQLGVLTGAGDISVTSNSLALFEPVSVGTGHTIALTTDTLSFVRAAALTAPSGTVILEPLTLGRPVDLGSAGNAGTLDILPVNLNRVTASTLQIGSATAGPVNVGDAINAVAETVDLSTLTHPIPTLNVVSGAAVTEGGVLVVGTLQGSVQGTPGSAFLENGNSIATLGSFSATGGFALTDATGLTVVGPVVDPPSITLNVTGPLAISGLLNAPVVDLFATGAITEPGGTIVAGTLSGSGTSISLISPGNTIGTVEGLTATAGNLSLTDSGDLVIFGAPSVNGALSGATVDLAVAGTVSEAGMGQIIATDLVGNAGQANLTAPTNLVGQLGSFGAVAGFTLVDGEALSVTGPVSGGTAIALTADGLTTSGTLTAPIIDLTANTVGSLTGNIVETAGLIDGGTSVVLTAAGSINQTGGVLAAGTLSGSSGGTTALPSAGNTVAALGSFSSTGGFTLADGEALTVPGPVTDSASIGLSVTGALALTGVLTAPDISLIASGAITQPSGALVASGTLSGSSGGSTSLLSAGNSVATLGGFTSGGDFALADGVAVTFVNAVSVGSGHTLSVEDNQVTIGAAGVLSASLGTIVLEPLTAGTPFGLTGAVASLPFTANTLVLGSLAAGPVTISGNVNLAGVNVLDVLSGGAIAEAPGAVLTVGTLEGQAGGSASFTATNTIATLGSFSANGGFALIDATGLTVAGPVVDPPNITLDAPSLTITGLVSAPGTVDLIATAGTISEPGGTVDAGVLTGSGASVALTNSNTIGTLDDFFASPGDFALVNTGNLVIGGVVFGGTVDLVASGTISEAASGAIDALTLVGSAAAATLDQTTNFVGQLGNFTTGGGFVLTDGEALTVIGPVTGASITLNSCGPLTVSGQITAPVVSLNAIPGTLYNGSIVPGDIIETAGGSIAGATSVVLTATGSIDQTGGVLTAGTLSGASGGTTALPSAGNAVANLGSFSSTGGFALADGEALTVAGPVTDSASIALSVTGGLALGGTLTAPDVTLIATGAITEPGGAIITGSAGALSGSGAAVSLNGANTIGTLGAFSATADDFALTDTVPVTFANTVSVGSGHTLTVEDNQFTIGAAGSLAATLGTIVLEPLTAGTPFGLTGAVASLPFTANTLVFGSLTSGPVTISGNVNLAGVSVLDVLSGAAIAEAPGAVLTVGTLEGQAGTSASFTATNSIATLGGFSATGGFALVDATGLTVSGPVIDPPGITITTIGTLTVAGILSAPTVDLIAHSGVVERLPVRGDIIETTGGEIGVTGTTDLVSLTADGLINQTGGALDTVLLSGSSGLTTSLAHPGAAGNAVADLGSFKSKGGFTLTDAEALTVPGPVSDSASIGLTVTGALALGGTLTAPAVSLTASGNITQPSGAIVATTLSGSSGGATSLISAGNSVATLGGFTSGGDFALADGVPVTLAAGVSVGSGHTLTVEDNQFTIGAAGVLSASLGTIVLEPLTAGTPFGLTGAVASLPFTANTLVLGSLAAGPVTISGNVNLAGVNVLDVLSGAAIAEAPGAVLTVGTLEGQAGTSASFTATNTIAALGGFNTSAGFALADTSGLTVVGPVDDTSASGVVLNVTGPLAISGLISAPNVSLTATGAISEPGGTIATGTLSGSAAAASLTDSNAVATLAGFTTSGGFALTDGQGLLVSAPVTDGTSIALNVTGPLALGAALAAPNIALDATGAITETGGTVTATMLSGSGASATLNGANVVANLGGFSTAQGFALTDAQALTLAGPVTDTSPAGVFLNVAGALTLAGNLSAPNVNLVASGAIVQQSGTFMAGTLSASASGIASFGGNSTLATAAVGTLGPVMVQNGTFALTDIGPLTINGPLSAADLAISATGRMTLAGGTITTLGLPLAQQFGAEPAAPGSFLQVLPGSNGTAQFVQLGTTVIDPPNGTVPTLRIQVPDTGGTVTLNNLVGPTTNLVLANLSGPNSGNINVGSLNVIGASGLANLFGTVAGITGPGAARISVITPAINPNYLLNDCVIMAASCRSVVPVTVLPGLTGSNPQLLLPPNTFGQGFLPGEDEMVADPAIAEAAVRVGLGLPPIADVAPAECRSVGSLDTLTSDCLDLILPNISDRDY